MLCPNLKSHFRDFLKIKKIGKIHWKKKKKDPTELINFVTNEKKLQSMKNQVKQVEGKIKKDVWLPPAYLALSHFCKEGFQKVENGFFLEKTLFLHHIF